MMIRSWMCAFAALAASAGPLGQPAQAQPPADTQTSAEDEVFCVYDALLGLTRKDLLNITSAFVTEATEGELFDAVEPLLSGAAQTCIDQYAWNMDQADAALTIGLASVVSSILEEWFLEEEGLPQETVDTVVDLLSTLPEDAFVTFLTTDWRRNQDFVGQMEERLQAAGLEDDPELMIRGMTLLEAYLLGMSRFEEWPSLADG